MSDSSTFTVNANAAAPASGVSRPSTSSTPAPSSAVTPT
ncbi:Uncharacterised protein [Mycobacteroides abscessus subsp. abscessus]|nr:Uncharacterised protein [Mycobacteroides abscessus subsp. abscessus]